jgi:hypothetical protein
VPPDVGYLSVYSKSDGIVRWRACLDPAAEHLEIKTSHVGMSVHPRAYRAIAQALTDFRQADPGPGRRQPRAAGQRPAQVPKARPARLSRAA